MKKIFKTYEDTSGISYLNGLICVVGQQTIDVISMTEDIVTSTRCPLQSQFLSLSTDTNRLLLSDLTTHYLYCCNLDGSVRWKFSNDNMKIPTGVTTDNNGNVYVVCNESNNVVIVSPDGKHCKELLTERDGLQKPTVIFYNKSNDCLLVCNDGNGDAFIFDVKHSVTNE